MSTADGRGAGPGLAEQDAHERHGDVNVRADQHLEEHPRTAPLEDAVDERQQHAEQELDEVVEEPGDLRKLRVATHVGGVERGRREDTGDVASKLQEIRVVRCRLQRDSGPFS